MGKLLSTPSERLATYKSMLTITEQLPVKPLCVNGSWESEWFYSVAYCRILFLVDPYYSLGCLTELMKYKPKTSWEGSSSFWFDPYDRIRLRILERIIYRMEHPILGWFKDLFQKVQ